MIPANTKKFDHNDNIVSTKQFVCNLRNCILDFRAVE